MRTYRIYFTPTHCVRYHGYLNHWKILCLKMAGFKVKIWTP